jgi:1-acyl-sn-glycerol-3-phosphate acyltransferase
MAGYPALRAVVSGAYRLVWRPTVSGLENIPTSGPVILASNHLSFIDSVVIPLTVPRQVRFLAKAEYFEGRGLSGFGSRLFFTAVDAVPVRRENQRDAMDSLRLAIDVLANGEVFGIYPEGTRSRDGRIYRGRTGVGWLALESGAPVVPLGLNGTDQVQPVGRHGVRIAPITVRVGPPIDPQPWLDRVATSGGAGRARREITDTVMDAIADLSGQKRAEAYNERPAVESELERP